MPSGVEGAKEPFWLDSPRGCLCPVRVSLSQCSELISFFHTTQEAHFSQEGPCLFILHAWSLTPDQSCLSYSMNVKHKSMHFLVSTGEWIPGGERINVIDVYRNRLKHKEMLRCLRFPQSELYQLQLRCLTIRKWEEEGLQDPLLSRAAYLDSLDILNTQDIIWFPWVQVRWFTMSNNSTQGF